MTMKRAARVVVTVTGLLCAPGMALAQTAPPHVPLQKTIGQQIASGLSVAHRDECGRRQSAGRQAHADRDRTQFDRIRRSSASRRRTPSHLTVAGRMGARQSKPRKFHQGSAERNILVFSKDGSGIREPSSCSKSPKLEGDRLTFDVDVLEGDISGGDGPASLFIDIIGRPFTPLSLRGGRPPHRVPRRDVCAAGAAGAAMAPLWAYGYRPITRRRPPTIVRPAATTRFRPATDDDGRRAF